MNPTDAYYKTKRSLLIFVGCLLIAIFVGVKITQTEQKISILPFQLERPEYLSSIFAIAVLFYLFQFALQWAAQQADVQNNRFYKIDFISITTIGCISVLLFLRSLLPPFPDIHFEDRNWHSWASIIGGLVGVLASILAAKFTQDVAKRVGRYLKKRTANEDDDLRTSVTKSPWVLHFNPSVIGAKKAITFNADGTVGDGRNQNEHTWRVNNGLLEILNDAGHVYSRFSYDRNKNQFAHTNDLDTLSIKSQTITSGGLQRAG
jgi:hypothetical protein